MLVAPHLNVQSTCQGTMRTVHRPYPRCSPDFLILVRFEQSSASATVMQKQGDCVDTWTGSASHINSKLLL
jgi:hypothetical protein